MSDSLFKGDTLYILDVIFFKIIDRLLIAFYLLIGSFLVCELYLEVTQLTDCQISDSLLTFVSLLLDLTGEICVRFWSCVSKNCSKEPIPSLGKKMHAS